MSEKSEKEIYAEQHCNIICNFCDNVILHDFELCKGQPLCIECYDELVDKIIDNKGLMTIEEHQDKEE